MHSSAHVRAFVLLRNSCCATTVISEGLPPLSKEARAGTAEGFAAALFPTVFPLTTWERRHRRRPGDRGRDDPALLRSGACGRSAISARSCSLGGGTQPLLVALSGYGRDEDKERATKAGFDHHLTKPVVQERVQALLAMLGAATLVRDGNRATH